MFLIDELLMPLDKSLECLNFTSETIPITLSKLFSELFSKIIAD
jgi:hypothetical protein